MNTERPITRPFENIEGFQQLLDNVKLIIEPIIEGRQTLKSGETYRCEFSDIRTLGLTLVFNLEQESVNASLRQAKLTGAEVEVLVIIDAPFLRSRKVINLGPLIDLNSSYVICSKGDQRDLVFQDRRHGFSIEVCFVLGVEKTPKALSPFRKGSVLAASEFSIKPLSEGEGLNPQPLDEENRRRLKLPSSTDIFVEVDAELLEIESFEGNVHIWMNEELFGICNTHKTKQSVVYLQSAAISALIQLVYLVSAELQDKSVDEIESNPPMVINVLHSHFRKFNAANLVREDSFVSILKSSPEKIAAIFSGIGESVKLWKNFLDAD